MNEAERANRNRLLDILGHIPSGVPAGWERSTFAVGGLMYLGFSRAHPEKLIVISTQGERMIDCGTGEKTRCEVSFDEEDLIALAGDLGGETMPIAGEGGGGLQRFSPSGDALAFAAPFWPRERVIFMPNYASWFEQPAICTVLFDDYELRAFGFSRCGTYMAVGSSSTLDIFRKLEHKERA